MARWAPLALLAGIALSSAACGLSQPIPPVAEAGPPLAVKVGQPVHLDGSGSFDPAGGSIVRYAWTIVGAPAARAEEVGRPLAVPGPQASVHAVLASETDGVGIWTVELEVTDDEGRRATDIVTVTVTP